jgi:hypothetical protein
MTDPDQLRTEQFPAFLARALAGGLDLSPAGTDLQVDRIRVRVTALPGEGLTELADRVLGAVRERLEAQAERGSAR